MKTITEEMQEHLDGTVTTLATIWKITRTDGKQFFFTDHDIPISYDGDTYEAASGYNRTAVSNNTGLSVDNLDVEGVFDSDAITEDDLRAGKFDYAEIQISIVNWANLSMGQIKMRRGRLGEVIITQQGMFQAELRGLTQNLSQNICNLYQAECRADLGDAKCGISIMPDILAREQTLSLGETYRVLTKDTTTITWEGLVDNGSFEADEEQAGISSITGWTIVSGSVDILEGRNTLDAAYDGVNFLAGGTTDSFEVRKDVALEGTFGIEVAQIDEGNVTADFSCYRAQDYADTNLGRVLVQYLNESKNPISTMYDTGDEYFSTVGVWVQRSASDVAVPALTRYIRIRFIGTLVDGSTINTDLDCVTLSLNETNADDETYDIYENRVYSVTTAGTTDATQPTYDTTVDAATTDGDAVLTCEEAWTRSALITSVTSRKVFTIEVDDEGSLEDDWYNYGGCIFQSGANEGLVMEIKDWDATTKELTLYLSVPFTIYPGTKIKLYPGCDKSLETCRDKFDNILNYRGEPYVPGQDELSYYNSSSY